jgi:capsule polysaccharide export protein KpsE/RkpR
LAPDRSFAEAQRRLRASLDGLEAAISRHNERAMEQADQAAEFSALQDDRSRLAQQLYAAMTRLRALENANGEAERRIERASAAVRAVIAADASQGG